ncbi:MAG: Fic family protein [Chloroflexota bacterium]
MNLRFTITYRLNQGIAYIERARGFLDAVQLSEAWMREMSAQAFLLEAHHTTHIEGTHLTLDEAAQAFAGQIPPHADADDLQELLNYRDAFSVVTSYLQSGAPVTEALIREIHQRLVKDVRGNQARPGQYRLGQNYVANSITGEVIYTPPPPGAVPGEMQELVEWLNQPGEIHPILVSGIAQFQLVHIHPFMDGNGRTSRLLSTLCLYRAGYDFKRLFTLSEYYDRDRAAFYAAIQGVREADLDLTSWLEYFVSGLATQLTEVQTQGRRAVALDESLKHYRLAPRQTEVLRYLLIHPSMNIQDFERLCPAVARRTLQRDLGDLLARGLLRQIASSPTDPGRRYELNPEL